VRMGCKGSIRKEETPRNSREREAEGKGRRTEPQLAKGITSTEKTWGRKKGKASEVGKGVRASVLLTLDSSEKSLMPRTKAREERKLGEDGRTVGNNKLIYSRHSKLEGIRIGKDEIKEKQADSGTRSAKRLSPSRKGAAIDKVNRKKEEECQDRYTPLCKKHK